MNSILRSSLLSKYGMFGAVALALPACEVRWDESDPMGRDRRSAGTFLDTPASSAGSANSPGVRNGRVRDPSAPALDPPPQSPRPEGSASPPAPALSSAPAAARGEGAPAAPSALPSPSSTPARASDVAASLLYRDLIVTSPEVVGSRRASNSEEHAPWSFRTQMQWLAGAGREPAEFTRAWLEQWSSVSSVGPAAAPVAPRSHVGALLIDPWLADASPAPERGATPGSYAAPASGPRWDRAPFRLIAIVNRVDLASDPCTGFAGELRYIYAALDATSGAPLRMTVIFELPYPTTRSAADWARAWSALANESGDDYAARLELLTAEVAADADPLRARVRTNEAALAAGPESDWELREFTLELQGGALALVQAPLEFTPRSDVDPGELAQYVLDHADAVRAAGAALPDEMRAGASSIPSAGFRWPLLGVSEGLRQAFNLQTCNGCHGGASATLPFQHVAAPADWSSPAQLSRFLYDPDADSDELERRSDVQYRLSAASCTPASEAPGYSGR